MTPVLTLASLTLREALRKKVLLGAVVLTICFLGLFALGVWFIVGNYEHSTRSGEQFEMAIVAAVGIAGLYVINSISGLLAIVTASGAIAGEIDQGTLQPVIPRPLRRWQVLIGKWLGYAVMLAAYIALTSLAAIGIVWAVGGYFPSSILTGVGLMILGPLLLLSLCIAGSTCLPTIANAIVVFILYSLATLGGMIEQIGWLASNHAMVNTGILSSLLMPTDSIWKMAVKALQPDLPLGALSAAGGPFVTLNPPSIWMAVYAALYAGVSLLAAVLIFQRRDL